MAFSITTTARLQRIKRTFRSAAGWIARTAVFLGIALGVGTLSSWFAVQGGTRFNTERVGPWTKWSNAGRPGADPYSRARFNKRAELVFNADLATRYEAQSDSGGRQLHSSCNYAIEGMRVDDAWWSLAVFDGRGRLIANAADRYGFNAATIAHQPDGNVTINLGRDAQPYNWLPTTRAGRLIVILEIQTQAGRETLDGIDKETITLPQIRRTGCR